MKPLYVFPGSGARISVQGPALRIDTGQRAPAVVAMRHVSQIVCPEGTRWTSRALGRCMRSGVPVVFTTDDGNILGFLYGKAQTRRSSLFQRLRALIDQPEGLRIYQTWWKAMESRRRQKLARRLRIPADRYRCRTLVRFMRRARLQRAPEAVVAQLDRIWNQSLAGFIAERLGAMGMDAYRQRTLYPQIDLAGDFQKLLEWELFLPALETLNRVVQEQQDGVQMELLRARMLARFQCLKPQLQEILDDICHRLDLRLLEEGLP